MSSTLVSEIRASEAAERADLWPRYVELVTRGQRSAGETTELRDLIRRLGLSMDQVRRDEAAMGELRSAEATLVQCCGQFTEENAACKEYNDFIPVAREQMAAIQKRLNDLRFKYEQLQGMRMAANDARGRVMTLKGRFPELFGYVQLPDQSRPFMGFGAVQETPEPSAPEETAGAGDTAAEAGAAPASNTPAAEASAPEAPATESPATSAPATGEHWTQNQPVQAKPASPEAPWGDQWGAPRKGKRR